MAKSNGGKGQKAGSVKDKVEGQRKPGDNRYKNCPCLMCGKENCWIAKCSELKELKAKRDAGTEEAKDKKRSSVSNSTKRIYNNPKGKMIVKVFYSSHWQR